MADRAQRLSPELNTKELEQAGLTARAGCGGQTHPGSHKHFFSGHACRCALRTSSQKKEKKYASGGAARGLLRGERQCYAVSTYYQEVQTVSTSVCRQILQQSKVTLFFFFLGCPQHSRPSSTCPFGSHSPLCSPTTMATESPHTPLSSSAGECTVAACSVPRSNKAALLFLLFRAPTCTLAHTTGNWLAASPWLSVLCGCNPICNHFVIASNQMRADGRLLLPV